MNEVHDLFGRASEAAKDTRERGFGSLLSDYLDPNTLIGDVIETGPDTFKVLVHDHYRRSVQGIPLRSFLVATRLAPDSQPLPRDEDARLVLLRVIGADRATSKDVDLAKLDAARRASGASTTWDDRTHLDDFTLNELRFDILICRVVGSFELRIQGQSKTPSYGVHYSYDVRDTYRGLGYKAYKPMGENLSRIVNHIKPATDEDHHLKGAQMELGLVRYTSAGYDPAAPGEENVPFRIDPTDLLSRKSALFGMSRTGKSNTGKVIMKGVYRLRDPSTRGIAGRVGMLVFDANGEYANLNLQDGVQVPTAIRDVWRTVPGADAGDVLVYGWTKPAHDTDRRLIRTNFFGSDPKDWGNPDEVARALAPLVIGKEIIDDVLSDETAKYIREFRDTRLDPKGDYKDDGERIRYRRSVTAYRALLSSAGYDHPALMRGAYIDGLFSEEVRAKLADSGPAGISASEILGQKNLVGWDDLSSAIRTLAQWVHDAKGGYKPFNEAYRKKGGKDWADATLSGILSLFTYPGGIKVIKGPTLQHSPAASEDFADEIATAVRGGKFVIIDQSTGDPALVAKAAERIMWTLYRAQKDDFVNPRYDGSGQPKPPPDVLVYVEEAHNLLPSSTNDVQNIWSRTAKETSKFKIGLLMATQEPSLIQRYILSNTDNWFLGFLFSRKEVKTLNDYGDFEQFEAHISQNADPGLLVVRTLSNPYSVPVQVHRFKLQEA